MVFSWLYGTVFGGQGPTMDPHPAVAAAESTEMQPADPMSNTSAEVWNAKFKTAQTFLQTKGVKALKENKKEKELCNWLLTQMKDVRDGTGQLTSEQREQLKTLDSYFVQPEESSRITGPLGSDPSSTADERWLDMYNRLIQYKARNGTAHVPLKHHDRGLVCWCREQRRRYKSHCTGGPAMSQQEIDKLKEIDFVFIMGRGRPSAKLMSPK
jgi:hypothetical protein